ncbi:MAG TPA: aminotransferase class IV [Chitinophagales bacterium]|nr:aminotransferase class IV [Chitinophagales bacterium]
MKYINYNGTIHSEHEQLIPATNRAFRYGDSFFETMAMFNKKIPLLDYHWNRMEFTAEVLGMQLPKRFHIESFQEMLLDLASVNDAVKNARVRLQLFRKGIGRYLPDEDELGFMISLDKLENERFEAGNGLVVGIRQDCYKPVGMISDLKTTNALPYILAAKFAKVEGWDECIILSNPETISEAIHSNVFIVKGDRVVTPHLDSGCVNGVMRTVVMQLLGDEVEEREVNVGEVLNADEILLTNAVRGIHWVKSFQGKNYANKKAVELTAFLNDSLFIATT